MKKYNNYYRANLALSDEEYKLFIKTGKGIKNVFMTGIEELIRENVLDTKEEEI